MTPWLGVVQREHVLRGVALGIAQVNHGKKAGLSRLSYGDWFTYYSPRVSYPDGAPLKAFTAIGTVADHEVFQGEDGDFRPFRRRVEYVSGAREVPIAEFEGALDLTGRPNWGYQLRRGLIPLTDHDLGLLRHAMVG